MAHSEENNINHTLDFKILDNKGGKVCETYPEILVVPSRISYESLIKCAKFRSK